MKIRNINIEGAVLAPMAGFTDVGFRRVAAHYGAQLTYTEMVSAKGLIYNSDKTRELLATSLSETTVGVQLFGSDPDIIVRAATLKELDKFQLIDINMGCPVPKIVKNGEGSQLLNNPELAYAIIAKLRSVTSKAITVKMRIGFRHGEFTALPLAQAVEAAGADAITVHGRTREQFYAGDADWEAIARVVQSVRIPVIANGDVKSVEDYNKILEVTKAYGVMIGRGALGNPQIFNQILVNCSKINTKSINVDKKRDILMQIEELCKYHSPKYVYSNMKKHICYYLKGKSGVGALRNAICRVESLEDMLAIVNSIDFD